MAYCVVLGARSRNKGFFMLQTSLHQAPSFHQRIGAAPAAALHISHFLFHVVWHFDLKNISNGSAYVKRNMKARLVYLAHDVIVQWLGLVLGVHYPVGNPQPNI